ncbi:MAG: ssDNA-binding domain-containing protein [Clostridiales bacterium]|jgi:antirestriction protein ArdC|nr:ssDNA-binding domain-containing protein [Clostridiales bacterium]
MSENDSFEKALEKLSPQQQKIVAQILENLDDGRLVWRRGWNAESLRDSFGAPHNPVTGTVYQGLNAWWLASQGYSDPRWLTFNQITEKSYSFKKNADGSSIAKGKGVGIEFYSAYDKLAKKPFDKDDPEFVKLSREEQLKYFRENVTFPRKNYTVFNASLIDGIEPFKVTEEDKLKRNETVERIFAYSEAPISYDGGVRVYYSPSADSIHLPPRASFVSSEELYGTGLHEIGHSTGHGSRLKRDLSGSFGSKSYAREELVAEFSSTLMSVTYGVVMSREHIENHAAYIQSWAKDIRENPQILIDAIRDAQKIASYINDRVNTQEKNKDDGERLNEKPTTSDAAPILAAEVLSPKGVSDITGIPLETAPSISGAVHRPVWIEAKAKKRLSDIEANVPSEMKALPNWCAFNAQFVKGDPNAASEKDRQSHHKKLIWDCNQSGVKKWASSIDPSTWTTFDKALAYAKANACDGLSFALTKESRIFCVDLDGVKTDGKYSPLAWEISNNSHGTYAERSVSGNGLHFFGLKDNSFDTHPVFNGSMGNKSADGKFELYDNSRFMSITGDIFINAKKRLAAFTENDKLIAVAKSRLSEKQAVTSSFTQRSSYFSQSMNEVIERIRKSKMAYDFNALYSGQDIYNDHSRSDMRLCGIAAFFSGGDAAVTRDIFVSSGLYRGDEKSKSYVERTVANAVKNTVTQIKPPKNSGLG